MFQLQILSGTTAGASWVARRFPVRVGRGAGSDLRVEAPGVWDEHLRFDFRPKEGICLSAKPGALTIVNGQAVEAVLVRNGDLIQLGDTRLRFWLSPTRQRALALREGLAWTGIGLVCLAQIALIYWLVKFV